MEQYGGIFTLVIMVAIMWFLLIRPAQKRQKAAKEMQTSLKRGDEVVTIGGIHGTVDAVDETSIFLRVSETTVLRFDKQAVGRVVTAS
ncbi:MULTISPECIES: preprotein translocase subunit YajC [unclassified Sporosarcina]|uniref:preprotein translocase subunit YajC n=2 Tax=Sporosarcina TaxID=1569 RepID=UPI000C167104|nr:MULTISPECIES: preprotein translocase subunit YajC [unclassified Sporosarcina]PIC87443.1 preprotein translocase subunit YajC [Sporosarcina sp. P20a]PIC98842.1 preprotein translocase subunit YajC [Sporosarcina sp. P29]PID05525.1 preprotein translocase subunit YajC [Sporosarcina sp. P30]PID08724.1 preprotein translocase subunit YajC [Sporosarcina sp. P31]PID11726.1 preprotein translocase subunit YajC [Sporosarcina sp. P32b]